MSPFAIAMLAVSMSVDAFAVSIARGAAIGRPRVTEAVRTGAVFGIVETIMPLMGWALGFAASRFVAAIDHWIAFGLLGAVGLHMIYAALSGNREAARPRGLPLHILIATAIGTSIDAMAIGVSLAFFEVSILVVALSIGLTTFLMSSGGMMIGRLIGERFGRAAEALGGMVLVGLGLWILIEHLAA